ncbi:hypothetical protein P3T18_002974 [Paraburkholderia sp. GAS199]
MSSLPQTVANSVSRLTDFRLYLADEPFGGALDLSRPVAGHLADGFLDGPLDLLRRSFEPVPVHDVSPNNCRAPDDRPRSRLTSARFVPGLPERVEKIDETRAMPLQHGVVTLETASRLQTGEARRARRRR